MNRALLLTALVSFTIGAHADERDIAKLVGHYTYESYQVTLPNGQTGGFEMHGATGAETDIRPDHSILFQLYLADGRTITEAATLVDAQFDGNVGFLIQRWPNMNYEVRTEVELTSTGLSYTNRFQNKADRTRYGMVERATLKRVSMGAHAHAPEDVYQEILRLNQWSMRAVDFADRIAKDMPLSSRGMFLEEFSLKQIEDFYLSMLKRYFSKEEALIYAQFLRTSAGAKLAAQTTGESAPQFSADEKRVAQEFAKSPAWDAFSRLLEEGIPELRTQLNARMSALLKRIEVKEGTR